MHLTDAVTIVLFKVLGAFANRPFDPSLSEDERVIDVGDVSSPCSAYSLALTAYIYSCAILHTALQVFLGIAQFVVVVLASVVIGFVVGMIAAFITRFSEHVHGEYLLIPHLSRAANNTPHFAKCTSCFSC